MGSLKNSKFVIVLIAIATIGCSDDANAPTDPNNYLIKLTNIPDIDLLERDLTIKALRGGRKRSINHTNSEIGDLSVAACSAKTLRNRSIRLSQNANYLLSFIKELELKCADFVIDSVTTYYSFENFELPFKTTQASTLVRVVLNGSIIVIDFITGTLPDQIDLQVYIQEIGTTETAYLIRVIEYWEDPTIPDSFLTQFIEVDTQSPHEFIAKFKQTGQAATEDGQPFQTFKYEGEFLENTLELFNISISKFAEDFTEFGGTINYVFSQWSKYDEDFGATKYVHESPPHENIPNSESWSVADNLIVENASSPYFDDLMGIELERFEGDFEINFIADSNGELWDGRIPDGSEAIVINFDALNLRDPSSPFQSPPTNFRMKSEDLTNCTGGTEELTEQLNNVD